MHVPTIDAATGQRRVEFGGVIYTESAEKAARFILDCNQNLVPLIFLHDVNGFMVGKEAEGSGIIRAGAKMVNAVANSVVPKITVICGGSFGAGQLRHVRQGLRSALHVCLAHRALRGDERRFGGRHAGRNQSEATGTRGQKTFREELEELRESMRATYEHQTDPRYAAARLWVDAILDPAQTRDALIWALEAAALNPDVREFKTGVLQT